MVQLCVRACVRVCVCTDVPPTVMGDWSRIMAMSLSLRPEMKYLWTMILSTEEAPAEPMYVFPETTFHRITAFLPSLKKRRAM